MVLRTGVSSVSIDPHAAVFCVEGELELLVVGFYRDEPAQFCSCDVSAVAGAFTGGIGFHAVRAAQGEVFRRVQRGESVLSISGEEEVGSFVDILVSFDASANLGIIAVGVGVTGHPAGVNVIGVEGPVVDVAQFPVQPPVCHTGGVLVVSIEGKYQGISCLIAVGGVIGSVFVLDFAVFKADAGVQVVPAASPDGVVQAQGGDPGGAYAFVHGPFVAHVVAEYVVAYGELQSVLGKGCDVVGAPVEHMTAGGGNGCHEVIPVSGGIPEIIVQGVFIVAHGPAAVVVCGNEAVLSDIGLHRHVQFHRARLAA